MQHYDVTYTDAIYYEAPPLLVEAILCVIQAWRVETRVRRTKTLAFWMSVYLTPTRSGHALLPSHWNPAPGSQVFMCPWTTRLSTHQHFLWYSSVRRVRPFQVKHSWSTRYTQYWLSTHDLYCFDECTRYFGSTSFIVFTQPHENLLNYSTPTITLAKMYYISAF